MTISGAAPLRMRPRANRAPDATRARFRFRRQTIPGRAPGRNPAVANIGPVHA